MARLTLLWLSLLLLLCGCAPEDPLDRKIKAGTPREFSRWWDRTRGKLPDAERAEAYKLIRYLQDSTPRLKSMAAEDHYDPLCKRINGITVRQLMVLAYEDSTANLQNRVMLETGKLTDLTNRIAESDDGTGREYAESMLRYTRERIAEWKERIADNDRRIAELTSIAPALP